MAATAVFLVLLAFLITGCGREGGGDLPTTQYVGRASCGECHAAEVAAHAGSDHDLAMDHATGNTVLGDFGDVRVDGAGSWTVLTREADEFFASLEGPDGVRRNYPIRYTFGFDPLQQYLVELEDGRIQRIPWSWDSRPEAEGGQRWFHVYDGESVPPESPLHWTRSSQNWNRMCADCHSTDLQKNYDPEFDRYQTTWSEIDVSCEACHGPASAHVTWARDPGGFRNPPRRAGFEVDLSSDSAEWRRAPGARTATRSVTRHRADDIESCARCHSYRTAIAPAQPGGRFDDHYRLGVPRPPLYHVDGQVREEVFVYGSFLQSRMARAGVGCGNCHDPHTTDLVLEGNALCGQCHEAAWFDSESHHRHTPGGEGSACVDCHMPETTFMQIDARRDHSFRLPRLPAADEPNACLGCHDDRDTGWLRSALADWTMDSGAEPPASAMALALAVAGAPTAGEPLQAIAGDPSYPAPLRAAALSYLATYPDEASVGVLEEAASDPSPLVRAQAALASRALSPAERNEVVLPLASDSVRLVRIAAARALAPMPRLGWTPEQRAAVDGASAELVAAASLNADDPAATTEFGDFQAESGRTPDAERAYRRSLRLEPAFSPAALNLADLLRSSGRVAEERTILETALRNAPDVPLLAYALGLHEVRAGRLDEAAQALTRASELDPSDARFPVAHALVLDRQERLEDAVSLLEASLPGLADPTTALLTLIDLRRRAGDSGAAVRHARTLVLLHPDDERYEALLDELLPASGGGQ